MRSFAVAIVVAGCHPAAPPASVLRNESTSRAAPAASADTCALVAAMLAIDNRAYQDLYANKDCGLDIPLHEPLVIDLKAPPALMSSGTVCPGRRFQLFHGDPDLQGSIIELVVYPHGTAWGFMATVVEPNPVLDPGGGFDFSQNYCHAGLGVVERTDHGWRAYEGTD